MAPNPAIGVLFHWLGGLASGSFYVPFRGVKRWAWETYWLVGGFFSWIIAPWLFASIMTSDLLRVLQEAPRNSIFWAYLFGVLWGLGGLTFGLTMRYLGMSLGMAMVLGYTAAFGTLMPPIFRGQFSTEVLGTHSGFTILIGVGICLLGIFVAGMAGVSKEREMSEEQKRGCHQGIQSEKRRPRRHFLRCHERLFRLWPRRGRSRQGNHPSPRHSGPLARPSRPRRRSPRRLHHKFHLVPHPECSQPHRPPILHFQIRARHIRNPGIC